MASGLSNGTKLFKGCRTLLDSFKSTTQAYFSTSAVSPKRNLKPSSAAVWGQKSEAGSKKGVGLLRPYQVSPALASFLGQSEISRPEAIKQIWSYIKLNNLQNPADRMKINCDVKLKALFDGRDIVGVREVLKFLSPHLVNPV